MSAAYQDYAQGKGLGFALQWRAMQFSDPVGKNHLLVKCIISWEWGKETC